MTPPVRWQRYHSLADFGSGPVRPSAGTLRRFFRGFDRWPGLQSSANVRALERVVMKTPTFATALLAIATTSAPALAQTTPWIGHGPEGGSISTVAVDPLAPSVVYAGTLGAGIFKSTTAGESWNGTGPENGQVVALAMVAIKVYAGRLGHGDLQGVGRGV